MNKVKNISQKKVFVYLFMGLSVLMILLPFVVSFNEVLTKFLEKNNLYDFIQRHIVPLEAKMMGVLFLPFGYTYVFSPTESIIVVNNIALKITWNCLGWQSFLLFVITLIVGFGRRYTALSMFEALIIGILGTFWLNIFRMSFTVMLAVHAPPVFRIVFHDYLAAFTTLLWLIFFWWFSYSYILEEKMMIKNK